MLSRLNTKHLIIILSLLFLIILLEIVLPHDNVPNTDRTRINNTPVNRDLGLNKSEDFYVNQEGVGLAILMADVKDVEYSMENKILILSLDLGLKEEVKLDLGVDGKISFSDSLTDDGRKIHEFINKNEIVNRLSVGDRFLIQLPISIEDEGIFSGNECNSECRERLFYIKEYIEINNRLFNHLKYSSEDAVYKIGAPLRMEKLYD